MHLRIEANERGAGFEFADEIVGGVVPNKFIPAVEKGCRETLVDGLIAGNALQLAIQAVGVVGAALYSGLVSFGLLKLIALVTPLRADRRSEGLGLDVVEHGEEAYGTGEGAILVLPSEKVTAREPAIQFERPVRGEA